jgi:hypothetical protein
LLLARRPSQELHLAKGVAVLGDQLVQSSFTPVRIFDGNVEEDLYMPESGEVGLDMPFENFAFLTEI